MDQLRNREAAYSALAWWVEAGVDVLVDEAPRDWLHPQAYAAPEVRAQPAGGRVAGGAAEAAARAGSLEELRAAIDAFEGCAYRAPGQRTVFLDGEPGSGLLLIGEAPGAEEDRQGLPFVGEAGKLLNRMLAAIGRDRSSALISNLAYWRPPGNRVPSKEEALACLPFTLRLIELVAPKVVVTLGAAPTSALLDRADGINRMRGRWQDLAVGTVTTQVMPTFHPAYLLRQPALKALAWADLTEVKLRMEA